jgi:hypothetical protein
MGQAFDVEHLELRGPAFILESHVGLSSVTSGAFSVSGAGILAHSGTLSESWPMAPNKAEGSGLKRPRWWA